MSDGRDDRVPALVARYGDSRITSYHTSRLAVMGNYQRNFALQYATGSSCSTSTTTMFSIQTRWQSW